MQFEIKGISVDTIDSGDQSCRVSSLADPAWIKVLSDSIDRIGMVQAPIVIKKEAHYRIISGFRRVAACRRLGHRRILCRLLAPETSVRNQAELAIAENAWQRPLNLMEKARAVALLEKTEMDPDRLTKLAEPLGLVENPKMIGKLSCLTRLPMLIQRAVESESLGLAMAMALGALEPEDARKILDLFQTFRFGLNRQRELLELIREIANRESVSIREVLASDDVVDILNRTDQDRPARGGALRRCLKKRRYPALTQAETAFNRLEKELALGPRVRLTPPPYFEGATFQLVLSFDTLEELNDHQQNLLTMSRHPHLKQFFRT